VNNLVNLIGSLRRTLRVLRSPASGGKIRAHQLQGDEKMVTLSPGKEITDPDEAEALGLSATARRLRQKRR
jgi:hypothetical protein